MAKYELALVVNAKIEDAARIAVIKRAKEYIERFGGTVGATEEWGRKRLAYEIQKMREGYFYFTKFESGPDTPNELEQNLRIMDNVLRYLIVRLDDTVEIGEPNETDLRPSTPEVEEVAEEAETTVDEAEEAVEEAAEEVAEETEEVAEEAAEEVEEAAEVAEELPAEE